jgi:hypothetical protein
MLIVLDRRIIFGHNSKVGIFLIFSFVLALSLRGGNNLFALVSLLIITGVCLFLALKKKRPFFLAVPFLSIFAYFLIQIILVPAPFMETVKFIFSLR